MKRKVADTLANSNKNKFWSTIKRLKTAKPPSSDVIDGYNGMEACNVFKRKYENLYNRDNLNELDIVKKKIDDNVNHCATNRCRHQLHYVTVEQVKRAISNLKAGQRENGCNLVSDYFLSGTDKLFIMLAFLFSIIIRHGFTCEVFNVIIYCTAS